MNSGRQPNKIHPQHQQNGVLSNTGHTPNGLDSQRQQNGVIPAARHIPNEINPLHRGNGVNRNARDTPNGINLLLPQNGITSNARHTPKWLNSPLSENGVDRNARHTPTGINPLHQQNGIIFDASHTPDGTSFQHERGGTNLDRQQDQSVPRIQAPMPLPPGLMEDDRLVTAIQVPVDVNERLEYVKIDIRTCALPGCECRFPDLRRFLGEHETREVDYQVFRALWEPPGMESLHGTYISFAMEFRTVDERPHLQWNQHFPERLKGDVFIVKVKEPRLAFTDPLGCFARTLPHQSGVMRAQYEHIDYSFFGSDLFTEMTLTATHPNSRVINLSSSFPPIAVGFWRACIQCRLNLQDYQVPPMTREVESVIARFKPPHLRDLPPWIHGPTQPGPH